MHTGTRIGIFLALTFHIPAYTQQYNTVIDEKFNNPGNFRPIAGTEVGAFPANFSENRLEIQSEAAAQLTGVYHIRDVSGNFYAETAFENDDAVGLVLIAAKGGKPDYDNYYLRISGYIHTP
jgi:hypothetical protein